MTFYFVKLKFVQILAFTGFCVTSKISHIREAHVKMDRQQEKISRFFVLISTLTKRVHCFHSLNCVSYQRLQLDTSR